MSIWLHRSDTDETRPPRHDIKTTDVTIRADRLPPPSRLPNTGARVLPLARALPGAGVPAAARRRGRPRHRGPGRRARAAALPRAARHVGRGLPARAQARPDGAHGAVGELRAEAVAAGCGVVSRRDGLPGRAADGGRHGEERARRRPVRERVHGRLQHDPDVPVGAPGEHEDAAPVGGLPSLRNRRGGRQVQYGAARPSRMVQLRECRCNR